MGTKSRVLTTIVVLFLVLGGLVNSTSAQEPTTELPLVEFGPYSVGVMTITFVDESREGRELVAEIWYPAIVPEGEQEAGDALRDAEPDMRGAPYPLILASHGGGGSRLQASDGGIHLASRGFVGAAMDHGGMGRSAGMFDRPLDVLAVLEHLATITDGPLVGVIDTDNAGVIGASAGGFTAMAMTGARVDPEFYLNWCDEHQSCDFLSVRAVTSGYQAEADPIEEGALWPALTDDRIRAVVSIVPPGDGPLFGERGFAAATTPTLILGATRDSGYELGAAFMYTHHGSEECTLISFIDAGHMFMTSREHGPLVVHLYTAFFGYYLQGQEDYAEYLTEDYVEQFEDLAWGVYQSE